MAADAEEVTVLTLFYLSAAFDRLDLHRLQTTHRVTGNALQSFKSYLHERYQCAIFADETSTPVSVSKVFFKILYLDRYCSFFTDPIFREL